MGHAPAVGSSEVEAPALPSSGGRPSPTRSAGWPGPLPHCREGAMRPGDPGRLRARCMEELGTAEPGTRLGGGRGGTVRGWMPSGGRGDFAMG